MTLAPPIHPDAPIGGSAIDEAGRGPASGRQTSADRESVSVHALSDS